ncbi:MAG TPA: UDP-N-acetylmuramate--L-alanine ligase [Bacteroidia bacterium]|nr:UDP-N-acetylmuramate--L-alanine ligase [Bacteroidia bacterium]
MSILDHKLYYFLGIGGIGMSALARFFKHHGKDVRGYDKTRTPLCIELENEGISCHYEENAESLETLLALYRKEEVLVVYTPAVPVHHSEYRYFGEKGYRILKRSVVLGEITRQYKTIAVAGTHGKTTTTTLITHLLHSAGLNCFAFMGGISGNFNSNLLLGKTGMGDELFVVEADEYDRSFLTLEPHIAVITSVDPDHLDIYGDAEHVRESYSLFAAKVRPGGVLLVKKNVDNDLKLTEQRLIYSLNLNTEYCAGSIRVEDGQFLYSIKSPVEDIHNVVLGLPGLHNVENSVAAVAVAQQFGLKGNDIREALRSFKGVKRRFDYRLRNADCIYIDDYAHHPEELKATINSVRSLYPGKKITGIFQPHLYSRTRDFVKEFAESLDLLDECLLMEIYPAREEPLEGVNSAWLAGHMTKRETVKILNAEEILMHLKIKKPEVLLSMGAGDIDRLVQPITDCLKNELETN